MNALEAYELAREAHQLAQLALFAAHEAEGSSVKLRDVTRLAAITAVVCPTRGCGALEGAQCLRPGTNDHYPHQIRADIAGVNGPERRREAIERAVRPVIE